MTKIGTTTCTEKFLYDKLGTRTCHICELAYNWAVVHMLQICCTS